MSQEWTDTSLSVLLKGLNNSVKADLRTGSWSLVQSCCKSLNLQHCVHVSGSDTDRCSPYAISALAEANDVIRMKIDGSVRLRADMTPCSAQS